MTEALGAEGFTHGSDVFLSSRHYQPATASGDALLAHELSHATGPAAATGGVFMKRTKKHLDFLRFKRKETQIARMVTAMALRKVGAKNLAQRVDTDKSGADIDHYGHWWVEAGSLGDDLTTWRPAESYGWWPEQSVSIAETLKIKRVEGILNAGNPKDPHHDESADVEFHPVMEVDDSESYEEIRDRVMGQVRDFAHNFKGSWNWRLGWGKNCHTFQDRMKKALGLHHQKAKEWLHGTGVKEKEKPKGFALMRDEFDKYGIMGGGFGMLNAARDVLRGKFTVDDLTVLTAAQRRQLIEEINKGQDGWNEARPSDLNEFFRDVTGLPLDFFTDSDGPTTGTTESPKPTTAPTEGSTTTSTPTGTNQTSNTGSPSPTQQQGRRGAEIDEVRLEKLNKQVLTLKKPLRLGSALLAEGKEIYVCQITTDHRVEVERSVDDGGGRFWVDAATLLAAVDDQRLGSESADTPLVNSIL